MVLEESLRRSVIDTPTAADGAVGSDAQSVIWYIAQAADGFEQFWGNGRTRDRQLRAFSSQESYYASAEGTIAARNAGFSWQLEGPKLLTRRSQAVLDNANNGEGWHDLIIKTTRDLSDQDNGAFWEIVRKTDTPEGELIGINHLDAARCRHTGVPEMPVIYEDRKGRSHVLKWYQVVTFSEMPVAVEGMYGRQMCALSRVLKGAQIFRNIQQYVDEKTSGRRNKAIHLISGIAASQVTDALNEQTIRADIEGLTRYLSPAVVSSVDPKVTIDVKTLELASLPDAFNEEVSWKHYIALLAMGFMSDFQEFAPLPGSSLGSGQQSETLHMKTRGKGPALFMKIISHALNFKILPGAVQFYFLEQDIDQELQEAMVAKTRAEARSIRIQSGELLPEEARQLAVDVGDLPLALFMRSGGLDLTPPEVVVEDEEQPNDDPTSDQVIEDDEKTKRFRFGFEKYV